MPRIQPVQITEAGAKSRQLLERVQKSMGMIPNLLKTMAHSAAALDGYLSLSQALSHALTPSLRERIALAVAGVNGCNYCASAHTALGRKTGIGADELAENLYGESSDSRTRAVLRFTRLLVEKRGWVSDEELNDIRASGFGDPEIAEIITIVALNLLTNYFNHVARTDIDFPEVDASKGIIGTGRNA